MNYAATQTLTLNINQLLETRRALSYAAACTNASGCLSSLLEAVEAEINTALDAALAQQLAA